MGFTEEDKAKICKEHMEYVVNEENEWGQMMETDVVEGPVKKVTRKEIVEEKITGKEIVDAKQKKKSRKATGPSDVSVEMIVASGEIGVEVMMELCQRV